MKRTSLSKQAVAGFTVIELLLALLIVGTLSAIAGPSWISINNRQKVNAVNDAVLAALQEAQQKAKMQKRNYSISFRTIDNVPQFASDSNPNPTNWQILANNVEVQSGKLLLGTNLTNPNIAGVAITYGASTPQTISFDHMGRLPPIPTPQLGSKGLIVAVAVAKSGAPTQPLDNTKRCVKVMTLLGAMQTAKQTGTVDDCKAL